MSSILCLHSRCQKERNLKKIVFYIHSQRMVFCKPQNSFFRKLRSPHKFLQVLEAVSAPAVLCRNLCLVSGKLRHCAVEPACLDKKFPVFYHERARICDNQANPHKGPENRGNQLNGQNEPPVWALFFLALYVYEAQIK